MKIHQLYKEYWELDDDNDLLLQWIGNLLEKNPKDIDVHYLYMDVLSYTNHDAEHEQKEPYFIQLCTEILKNQNKHTPIEIAKAYSYRGEMRYYAMDRRKDFDKARHILSELPKANEEVKFLKQLINLAYPLNIRQYLFFNLDNRNMFLAN